jgi:hypothetical protein
VIAGGSRTGHRRADGRLRLAHVPFAGPSRRAVVSAGERPATAVPDGPAVVVATGGHASHRRAHDGRANAEVVDAIPSGGTRIPAVERAAAAVPDLPAVVVARGRHAGVYKAGRTALADVVHAARPPGLRALGPAVERRAASVPNHSTIGPARDRTPGEANGRSRHAGVVRALLAGGTGATMQRLPAIVDVPAEPGCAYAARLSLTEATIRGARFRQRHDDGASVRHLHHGPVWQHDRRGRVLRRAHHIVDAATRGPRQNAHRPSPNKKVGLTAHRCRQALD